MAEGFASKTPGQQLREARQARGLELGAAHEGTKIPVRLLEAMERDEYHKVSGPLYVRSFLRNYAGWLEMDVEQVLAAYEALAGSAEAGDDDVTWSEDTVQVRRVGSTMRREVIIGAVAALVVVVVALALWLGGGDDGQAGTTRTAAVEPVGDTTAPGGADSLVGEVAVELPVPWPASSDVPLEQGVPRALVLRVLLPEPANCSVRADGQQAMRPVVWPEAPRPLPDASIEPGVAYAVRGGYAIYWGAEDNFTVELGELTGASAMLNGVTLPVERWQAGQPVVLDRHALDGSDG